jgi:DNA-directed RNA polymerase specialized sigma24 family protein
MNFKKRIRRQKRSAAAEQEILDARFPGKFNGRRPATALDQYIDSLKTTDRLVFLAYLGSESYRTISSRTRVAEPALRKRVQRLKEQLKAAYGR